MPKAGFSRRYSPCSNSRFAVRASAYTRSSSSGSFPAVEKDRRNGAAPRRDLRSKRSGRECASAAALPPSAVPAARSAPDGSPKKKTGRRKSGRRRRALRPSRARAAIPGRASPVAPEGRLHAELDRARGIFDLDVMIDQMRTGKDPGFAEPAHVAEHGVAVFRLGCQAQAALLGFRLQLQHGNLAARGLLDRLYYLRP